MSKVKEKDAEGKSIKYLEIKDKHKKRGDNKKKRKVLMSVLILVLCTIFVFSFSNKGRIDSGNIFSWILEDLLGIGAGQGYPVNIDGTFVENGNFKIINKNISMVSDISFTSFNKTGKLISNEQHSYALPKIKVKNKYAIIYNVGGKGFQIENRGSTIFKSTLESDIIAADISQKGDYIIVNKSNEYFNEMTLYSSKNEERYKYYFSEYYITDVAINKSGDYAAISGISAKDGKIKSAVYIFDFKSETPRHILEYDSNMLFSSSFLSDNNIVLVGDKGIIFANTKKGFLSEFSYEKRVLRCFESSIDEGIVVSLSATEDGRNCSVISFDTSGKQKLNIETELKVKDVSLKYKNVAVLESGKVYRYNLKGEKKGECDVGEDGKQIELFSSGGAYVLGVSEVYKILI